MFGEVKAMKCKWTLSWTRPGSFSTLNQVPYCSVSWNILVEIRMRLLILLTCWLWSCMWHDIYSLLCSLQASFCRCVLFGGWGRQGCGVWGSIWYGLFIGDFLLILHASFIGWELKEPSRWSSLVAPLRCNRFSMAPLKDVAPGLRRTASVSTTSVFVHDKVMPGLFLTLISSCGSETLPSAADELLVVKFPLQHEAAKRSVPF